VRALIAVLPALFLAQVATAQNTISFPTEDGGVVFADIYGTSDRAVVLAHGGRFNKESWTTQAESALWGSTPFGPHLLDMLYLYSEGAMLAIRLPQSIEKRLEKLARRTGRTKTYYVREAILEHLEDLEDLYLAEGALERIRNGEERTIPLKDVMKRHGLQR
jgi:RHH-type rel operon transcriptional repressor/antitoxin RelB